MKLKSVCAVVYCEDEYLNEALHKGEIEKCICKVKEIGWEQVETKVRCVQVEIKVGIAV